MLRGGLVTAGTVTWAAFGPAAAAFVLAGCAAPDAYAGIPLRAGAADINLQQLARRAEAGDRYALLELGMMYELGSQVERNLDRAEALYRAAATGRSGKTYVYVPAAGSVGAQVISVPAGPAEKGLGEAKVRLRALRTQRRGSRP